MTIAVEPPLDPFSEVLDERRRWTPDWYSWLSRLVNDVKISGGTPVPVTPAPIPWGEPLGLFDFNVGAADFPFSNFFPGLGGILSGIPTVRWNISGFSIIPTALTFSGPGQLNWYLRSTPVYLWASAWNQTTAGISIVAGAEAASANAIITGVNVRAPVGQRLEFHMAHSGTVVGALFRIVLWGKDE